MKKQSEKRSSHLQRISVAIDWCEGAGARPSDQELARLFERALKIVPARKRPKSAKLAVDVHVVGDAEIAELNQQHMKHAGATDVLSFPMGEIDPERGAFNLGEIVVSFETAQREAAARGLSFEEELSRYCVHGFLHLLGYEDDTAAQRRGMFAVQEKALYKGER